MLHSPIKKIDHPEYLTFSGNYVFNIPAGKVVDEQAITGMQLVYTGVTANKTLNQVYASNDIGVQPITSLKDHKGETFKKYVNDIFVPDLKKVLSTNDVNVQLAKADGWDVAKITLKKDGSQLRFIYLKNGQHPVAVISKEETTAFKKIEQSVTDVEKTDLKADVASLKQVIQTIAQQIRDKNAHDLYAKAASGLRAKNTEDQIAKLLAAEEVYSQGSVTINGGSFDGGKFSAVINFVPRNTDFKQAPGILIIQKISGQWQLIGMQLPNPAANKVNS